MLRRLVLLAPFLLPIAARADADTSGALSFVRQAGAELAAVVGRAESPTEKQERLEQFLARVADLDGLARFCLGRY